VYEGWVGGAAAGAAENWPSGALLLKLLYCSLRNGSHILLNEQMKIHAVAEGKGGWATGFYQRRNVCFPE
jgi:hypothetical protein